MIYSDFNLRGTKGPINIKFNCFIAKGVGFLIPILYTNHSAKYN